MATAKPVIFLKLLGDSAQYLLWLDVPPALQAKYAGDQTDSPYELISAAELAAIVAGEVNQSLVNIPMRVTAGGTAIDGQAMWDAAVDIRRLRQDNLNAQGNLLTENAYWNGTVVVLPEESQTPPGPPPSIQTVSTSAITQTGFTVNFEADQLVKAKVQYGPTFGSETALTSVYLSAGSIPVTGLVAATTYQVRLYIENEDGASFTSTSFLVVTSAHEVVFTGTGPVLGSPTSTSVTVTAGSSIAATMKVTLTTTVAPTTILQFGPTASGTSHSLSLTGLTPNTQYSWTATLTAGSDTETSAALTFTTANPPIVLPPGDAWTTLLGNMDGELYNITEETEPQSVALVNLMKNTFMTRAASLSQGIDIFNPNVVFDINRARTVLLSGGSADDTAYSCYWMYQATGDINFLNAARRIMEVSLTDPAWLSAGPPGNSQNMYPDFYGAAFSFALASVDDGLTATQRQLARNVVQNYAYAAAKYQTGDIFDCRNASHQVEWMLAAYAIGLTVIDGFVPGTGGTNVGPRDMAAMVKRKVDFMLDNQAAALTHKNQTLANNWRGFQETALDHSPLQPAPSAGGAGGFWYQRADGSQGGVQTQQTFIGNTTNGSHVVTWTGGANTVASLPTGTGRGFIHSQDGTTVPYGGSVRILPNWVSQVNTTSGSPVVTRGSGSFGSVFDQRMVGRKVTGINIQTSPVPTVVSVDTGAQTFTMSENATGSTAGTRVSVTVLAKDNATNTIVLSSPAAATATGVDFTVGGLHDTHRKGFMDGIAARSLAYYAVMFPADKARITTALRAMYCSDTPGPQGWYSIMEADGGPLGYANASTTLSPSYTYLTDGNGYNFAADASHYPEENGFHLPNLGYLIVNDPDEAEHYYDLAQFLIVGLLSTEVGGRPTGGAAQALRGTSWKTWGQIMDGMRFLSHLRLGEVEPPVQDIVYDAVAQFSSVQGTHGWSYLEGSTNTPMNWDAVDGRWEGALSFQNIRTSSGTTLLMHPGSTRGAKLRFTVSEAGAMRLSLAAWDSDISGGDGVRVIVAVNGVTIQSIPISNGQTTVATYNPVAFSVTAGDTIDLEVTAGSGTNNASDTTGILYTLTLTPGGSAPPPLSATVTVNVGTTQGAVHTKAVGFLSGISATAPVDAEITPLEPRMFRGNTGNIQAVYNRIVGFGATSQLFMLSYWTAYANANGGFHYPGDGGQWTVWENFVASVVNAEVAAGRSHEFELWNEPNLNFYWPVTATRNQAQWHELFRRGYNVIKGINPALKVVGPAQASMSTSADVTWMQNFLSFCKANNCVPDVLSWHEIPHTGSDTPWTVKSHIDTIRAYMTAQSITHPPISISEYGHILAENKPGVMLTYMSQLEQGTVITAAKSCWWTSDEPNGPESCGQNTLDGYLTLAGARRAGWRITAAYAALAGNFVQVVADHDILYGSASVSGTTVVALVGNPRNSSYGDRVVRFTGLTNGAKTVTRERLSQGTFGQDWVALGSFGATVSDTTLSVTVPAVVAFDAFRITITS